VLLIKSTLILFLSARALEHPSISEACITLYGYTNVTIPCLEPTAEQVAVLIAEGHYVSQIHVYMRPKTQKIQRNQYIGMLHEVSSSDLKTHIGPEMSPPT